jgi:hypothetical protein
MKLLSWQALGGLRVLRTIGTVTVEDSQKCLKLTETLQEDDSVK